MIGAFAAAVKRNDNEIGLFPGVDDEPASSFKVVDAWHAITVSKPDKGDLFTLDIEVGSHSWRLEAAGILDALLVEHLLRAGASGIAKIAGMVIRHAHHIKSGLL